MSRISSPIALVLCGLFVYGMIIGPFTAYMHKKPVQEKLGYIPHIQIIKPMCADQKELVGATLIMKVLMYFGGIVGQAQSGKVLSEPPDLRGMSRLLHGAVLLDPYNMDAYYFAQGLLTWHAKQYVIANDLMDYGMKYRTWDWYLPFFAGFNYAYFLKDYQKAADYYRRAAELSGLDLHKSLAGRYMQEAGQTELAINYLSAMLSTTTNYTIRRSYEVRLQAFNEVLRIERAYERFRLTRGFSPISVAQLVQQGFLQPAPVDPYGGEFYLELGGKVNTTSRFAYAVKQK